jgi:hypothetical protein
VPTRTSDVRYRARATTVAIAESATAINAAAEIGLAAVCTTCKAGDRTVSPVRCPRERAPRFRQLRGGQQGQRGDQRSARKQLESAVRPAPDEHDSGGNHHHGGVGLEMQPSVRRP